MWAARGVDTGRGALGAISEAAEREQALASLGNQISKPVAVSTSWGSLVGSVGYKGFQLSRFSPDAWFKDTVLSRSCPAGLRVVGSLSYHLFGLARAIMKANRFHTWFGLEI